MMGRNEIEMPALQARVGLQGEVEVLRHLPNLPLQGEHQEGGDSMKITCEELERLYWKQKMSLNEIAEKFDSSYGKVHYFFLKHTIPRRSKSEAHKVKYWASNLIEPDFSNLSTISYILGVWLGDGTTSYYTISLSQTRLDFAMSFKSALQAIGLHPCLFKRKDASCTQGFCWIVQASSRKFVAWLRNLDYPDIEGMVSKNDECAKEFIRGFFESEGSNSITPRWKTGRSWQIFMGCTDKETMKILGVALKRLEFNFKLNTREPRKRDWKPLYRVYNQNQVQNYRFIKEINPCVKNDLVEPHMAKKWSREGILEKLVAFYHEHNRMPTAREIKPTGIVVASYRLFGSWSDAKRAANFEVYPIGYNPKPAGNIGG